MNIELVFGLTLLIILVIQFITMILLFSKSKQSPQTDVLHKLMEYSQRLEKNESTLRDEFAKNREETSKVSREAREELISTIANFTKLVDNKIKAISDSVTESSKTNRDELTKSIADFTVSVDSKMKSIQEFLVSGLKFNRDELAASLKSFEEKSSTKIETLTKDTREGLDKNRETVEKKLADIQQSNEKKLDEMRQTVDEKLQKTLETRLANSFKNVSEQLEQVYKGLGEMKSLASDVGDLKKVMSGSSSKIKGVLGEYQLAAILEQMLSPAQYEKNVKTKIGSNEQVEFAIKIPSRDDADKIVYLPIDSKLPTSDYEKLLDAYNSGDKKAVDDAQKTFARTVKGFAMRIRDKYIDPPNTTDFAIMFLPFEGAYAEVVRDPELFESIQRDYKINITGPSTISAFLNALQVGFRSLAIEKQTSKIWSVLTEVKKEFGNFETVLIKVKEQIDKASTTLETEVGRRTRAINRTLKKVETLPGGDTAEEKLLVNDVFDNEE